MKKSVGNERLMLEACYLYYDEDMKQEEIAKKLGISRPTVSRLLKDAKDSGMVKIQIISPFIKDYSELEKLIENRYGFKKVIIVDDKDDELSQKLEAAKAAAMYLERIISDDNNDVVGLSMGTTILEIPQYISINKQQNVMFVPLLGGIGQVGIEIHPNRIVTDFGRAFGGDCKLLHAPAVISNPAIKESLMEEESIKNVFEYINKVNIAVVGVGMPMHQNSTMKATGFYSKTDFEMLRKKKAIGDICMQFYNAKGETRDFDSINEKVFGMSLDQLKRMDKVIAIAVGSHKLESIKGAVKGNFINILITNYSNGIQL